MFRRKKTKAPSYILEIGEFRIEVTRKRMKTIRLKVNAVTQKIRVSCPYRVSEQELMDFISSKKDWIEKQLSRKIAHAVIPEEKNYESGDKLFFKGKEFELRINRGASKTSVIIQNEYLILNSKKKLNREKREKAIHDFYRSYLKEEIPKLIAEWEPIMKVSVAEFGVKRMKTRWGTCNIRARRIWLNLSLAEKSPDLLEYVVVHEMVHLLERLHNKSFKAFMTQFLPNWRELEKQLNGRID